MSLNGIRRRPTLPGRFQPSTISVLRLNFCVRDGNRWIPQAIVTGNSKLSLDAIAAAFLVPTLRQSNCLASAFLLFALRLSFQTLAIAWMPLSLSHPPHPQNRTGRSFRFVRPRRRFSLLRNFFLRFTQISLALNWAPGLFPASSPSAPDRLFIHRSRPSIPSSLFPFPNSFLDQALDLLVSSSSIRYRTSTDDLSTLSSSRGLTCFIQWQFYSPGGLHA